MATMNEREERLWERHGIQIIPEIMGMTRGYVVTLATWCREDRFLGVEGMGEKMVAILHSTTHDALSAAEGWAAKQQQTVAAVPATPTDERRRCEEAAAKMIDGEPNNRIDGYVSIGRCGSGGQFKPYSGRSIGDARRCVADAIQAERAEVAAEWEKSYAWLTRAEKAEARITGLDITVDELREHIFKLERNAAGVRRKAMEDLVRECNERYQGLETLIDKLAPKSE